MLWIYLYVLVGESELCTVQLGTVRDTNTLGIFPKNELSVGSDTEFVAQVADLRITGIGGFAPTG